MFAPYKVNRQYLADEFANCRWDVSTGMDPDSLEKQINALWDARGAEPVSVCKARIQRYIVENAQLEVNPRSRFAGKLNSGITYKNFCAYGGMYERLFQRIRSEALERELPELYDRVKQADAIGICNCETDFWHNMPNWNDILSLGLPGLIERAGSARREKADNGELSEAQAAFYESVSITLSSVARYMERLIEYARDKGGMDEYVECVYYIRHNPPKTLYQAMMLTVLYVDIEEMGCERARTLGRLDQLYKPYCEHDLADGYAIEDIEELFRYFFGRYSQAYRFAAQPFCLCGTTSDGRDACNELTDLILRVYDDMDILDPKIHIRWHPGFSDVRLREIMRMIRAGHSSIVLVNDDIALKAYAKIGVDASIARDYLPLGCYEPMIMGREDAMIGASWLNIAKAVELAMNDGVDVMTGARVYAACDVDLSTFDGFYAAFLYYLDQMVEFTIDGIERQNAIAMRINPSPIYSATFESCIASGRDVFDPVSGVELANVSIKCCGIATAADALAALKQLVYDERAVSMAEMRAAIIANWEGYEALRNRALSLDDKFGNHTPVTDRLARDIYKHLAKLYVGRPSARGGVYRMGGDSVTRCIALGKGLCATPDGRGAGEAISKNFSSTIGMEKSGLSAAMLSALEIDHTDFCDACVLDFVAHPSALEGEKGLDAMVATVKVYFEKGGFAFQGNVLQLEELKDAQSHPDKYPNLQVRVCGWNEYFVNMSAEAQNEFIRRLEAV